MITVDKEDIDISMLTNDEKEDLKEFMKLNGWDINAKNLTFSSQILLKSYVSMLIDRRKK